MSANLDKPNRWNEDIEASVAMYNAWFLDFAPATMREQREMAVASVKTTLEATDNFRNITPEAFFSNPEILSVCRMSTCPPLAADRLIGFSGVRDSLVKGMEKNNRLPARRTREEIAVDLRALVGVVNRMLDTTIFPWVAQNREPSAEELDRAALVVGDRYCMATANPIVRNAQEKRQLQVLGTWLRERGYRELEDSERGNFLDMPPGTFSFRMNVEGRRPDNGTVNIPIDAVVMPLPGQGAAYPLLIEAKSAGDFTNVNKRRKEEAAKLVQLKQAHGEAVSLTLLLCGYFNRAYLEYEAAEGIDWVWEHRVGDFADLGL